MKIPSSIFKAYDIRGIVETELTPEIVKLIGRAVGSESIKKGERGVVVGRDGRLSGPELSEALISGLIESGCLCMSREINNWRGHHTNIYNMATTLDKTRNKGLREFRA